MKLKTKIAAVLTLTAVTGAAFAQQALKPEEMIKFRKAGYSFMSWNMGKIKAQVVDAPQSFNKDQVLAAALTDRSDCQFGHGRCTARVPIMKSVAKNARQAGVFPAEGRSRQAGDEFQQGSE